MIEWLSSMDTKTQATIIAGLFGTTFGAIGGIFARYIQGSIDDRNQKRRLRFEAEILRQQKLIDAQSVMLDELSVALWGWRYAIMRVAFYAYNTGTAEYELAVADYQKDIWSLLSKIRFTAARARRLVSENSFSLIENFYARIVDLNQDLMDNVNEVDPITKKMTFMDISTGIFERETKQIDRIFV